MFVIFTRKHKAIIFHIASPCISRDFTISLNFSKISWFIPKNILAYLIHFIAYAWFVFTPGCKVDYKRRESARREGTLWKYVLRKRICNYAGVLASLFIYDPKDAFRNARENVF